MKSSARLLLAALALCAATACSRTPTAVQVPSAPSVTHTDETDNPPATPPDSTKDGGGYVGSGN